MPSAPLYRVDDWLDDLKVCIKQRGETVAEAAVSLGLSRATAYRLVAQAKAEGEW